MLFRSTGLAFHHLKAYLGEDTFNKVMRGFFQQWKFKHPYPQDLQKAFDAHTHRNLDWFFGPVLQSSHKIDYKIKQYKDGRLLVKNREDIAAPLIISGFKDGAKVSSTWHEGFSGERWLDVSEKEADKYMIDPEGKMLELYRHNNTDRKSTRLNSSHYS